MKSKLNDTELLTEVEKAKMLKILATPEARQLLFDQVRAENANANAETDVQRHLRKIREAHTPEEVTTAIDFCERTFAEMIKLAPDNTTLELHWARIEATPRTKRMGLVKVDSGFIMHRWIDVDSIALFYIDVILSPDGTVKGSDREVAWNMIRYSEAQQTPLHPEWRFILNPKKSGIDSMELWTHEFK